MPQTQSEELNENLQKEEFSYSYLNAITAAAGYTCELKGRGMDNAGIDLTIEVPGVIQACLSPKFDAQVKCTAKDCLHKNSIHFELGIRNYARLIHPKPMVPQILIVVLTPSDANEWVKTDKTEEISTLLKASAYWISLRGRESTSNKNSITVKIPLSHRFLPEALRAMMKKIAQNEDL
jgi:Domain of unknown function (DUF4365)